MAASHAHDHDHHESDYQIGSMDVEAHKATYSWFTGFVKWGSLAMAVLVTFFTLLFCTGAGFFGSVGVALVLIVGGVFFLRSKPSPESH